MPDIFIDFECRKGRPPALLGTLTTGGHDDFVQWILSEPLHSAAKTTRSHLRVSSLAAVGEWLARDADRTGGPIVGWSLFDRDQFLHSADVLPRVKGAIEKRYVNAIPVAKKWRRTLLPDWHLESNELKAYFGATGFSPKLRRDIESTPADWIKHLEDQIATRGRYKDVTRQAKRDWDRLLTYNEDDCRALEHVYETAVRELALWDAYRETIFHVDSEPSLDLRIGWKRRKLDALLKRAGVLDWAFITASNPASRRLGARENEQRHRQLIAAIERDRRKLTWISGRGIGTDPAWPPEESVLVLGCDEPAAVALGQRFGQLAVVVGKLDEPARLVSCRTWTPMSTRANACAATAERTSAKHEML